MLNRREGRDSSPRTGGRGRETVLARREREGREFRRAGERDAVRLTRRRWRRVLLRLLVICLRRVHVRRAVRRRGNCARKTERDVNFLGVRRPTHTARQGSGQRFRLPEHGACSRMSLTCMLYLSGGRRTRRARRGRRRHGRRSCLSGRLHLFGSLCLRGASCDDWRTLYVIWFVRHLQYDEESRGWAKRKGKREREKGEMSTSKAGSGRARGPRSRAGAGKVEPLPLSRARGCCPDAQTRGAEGEKKGTESRRDGRGSLLSPPHALPPERVSETAKKSSCSLSLRESVAFWLSNAVQARAWRERGRKEKDSHWNVVLKVRASLFDHNDSSVRPVLRLAQCKSGPPRNPRGEPCAQRKAQDRLGSVIHGSGRRNERRCAFEPSQSYCCLSDSVCWRSSFPG